jgi:hypothetical protein
MSKQTHRMGKKSPVKILKGLEVQIFKITGMFYCKRPVALVIKQSYWPSFIKTTILQIAAGATFYLLLHII